MKMKNWLVLLVMVGLAMVVSGCMHLDLQHVKYSKHINDDGSYTENRTEVGVSDPLTAMDNWANGSRSYGSTGGSSVSSWSSSGGAAVWDYRYNMWRAKDSKLVMFNGYVHEVPKDHHLEVWNNNPYILDDNHHIESCGGSPWKVLNHFHTAFVDGRVKTFPDDPQLSSPAGQ